MLKNVFSRFAREIERRQTGKRRSHAPAPVPMQVEQLEPRQLMTATLSAPSTPVFSETYFLGSTVTEATGTLNTIIVDREIPVEFALTVRTGATSSSSTVVMSERLSETRFRLTLSPDLATAAVVNDRVAWLRPWQHTFDRTTQTLWFSNEDGARLGQLDTATGQLNLYDISLSGGTTTPNAVDPHGTFFDFDTHVTPRVWTVYRNVTGGTTGTNDTNGQVSYLDLQTNELVTVDLATLVNPAVAGSPTVATDLIKETHAAFVDGRGHLWVTVENSRTLIEFDFDQVFDGTINPNINSRTGRAIIHTLPVDDPATANIEFPSNIEPHGLGTIIDDRTGEQYIYVSDAHNGGSASNRGTARLYLLRPGDGISGNVDRWVEWDLDNALTAESRPNNGHALFLSVDENETPGRPDDDKIFMVDPGRGGSAPFGAIREIDPQSVIRALQATDGTFPTSSTVRTVRIPRVSNADQTLFSSPQLPFADREGNTFFVDALGSVGRFNFNDPGLTKTSSSARINTGTTTATTFQVTMLPTTAPLTVLNLTTVPIDAAGSADGSTKDGIDQYAVSQPIVRAGGNSVSGVGSFRGSLNAASVVYGSLAQSDNISSTIFAETARRQMSVVIDKTAMQPGAIVEGRMAFQVARNGSLIMTGRENGMLLDQQRNISRDRLIAGDTAANILIDGDSSAVTESNGNVHVFGKNQAGGLVEYRFNRAANTWDTKVFPFTDVLAGEPTAFIDALGNVGALINRHDGHLLLYRTNNLPPAPPIDLTMLVTGVGPLVYTSVAVVENSGTLYAYGANQAGGVVEYAFPTGTPTLDSTNVRGNLIGTPAQTGRDTKVFQSLSAVAAGGTRHIFGTDGHSRLVHLEITNPAAMSGIIATAENVTELTKVAATGYFDTFQQGTKQVNGVNGPTTLTQEFAARVYPELSVLVDPTDGRFFVYGTNGLDLVEFTRTGTNWTAANLTNDILKETGSSRIPANKVFGAPGAYITQPSMTSLGGDRHVFQINADGDVVEYAFRKTAAGGHFNTQNINLARGNTHTFLQDISVNLAPALNIPTFPLDVIAGNPGVLVASDAAVDVPATPNFTGGQLVVRTINGAAADVVRVRPQTLADGDVIAVAGTAVSFNGAALGMFTATGGIGSAPLVISFASPPSKDALEALLQSVEFSTPAGSTVGVRFVNFEFFYQFTGNLEARSNRISQQVTVDDATPLTNPLINPLL
ncbi:MAG: hypothetical protein ACKV2Q_17395 [Planctomycetaceae bacterium]